MPIESSVNRPADLNSAWPLDSDFVEVGAAHIRNLKRAVKYSGDGDNSTTVTLTGGLFSGGSVKIERRGNTVTLTGSGSHSSSDLVASDAIIPLWARPATPGVSTSYKWNPHNQQVTVSSSGVLLFWYSALRTSTDGFTISYVV